jgi:hypothetical protein
VSRHKPGLLRDHSEGTGYKQDIQG